MRRGGLDDGETPPFDAEAMDRPVRRGEETPRRRLERQRRRAGRRLSQSPDQLAVGSPGLDTRDLLLEDGRKKRLEHQLRPAEPQPGVMPVQVEQHRVRRMEILRAVIEPQ